ncbi:hypothetical protein GCM10018953_63560 [Streptosporangium nondiastaticum]
MDRPALVPYLHVSNLDPGRGGSNPGLADGRAIMALEEDGMTDRTYRVTEIVGTSEESIEAAVRNGIRRASQTLRHLDWFEVTEVRGHIVDGEVGHFQVGLKVGFRLEDA